MTRKNFQRLFATLVFASLVFVANTAYASHASFPKECLGKPPHYLVGLSQAKDQIAVFHQMSQVYKMSWHDSNARALWGGNLGEQVKLTFYGHTLTLYLPMYRRVGSSMYFDSSAGTVPLTLQEYECAKADLREWIQESIDENYQDYKKLSERAVARFAAKAGKTPDEVRAILVKAVPEYQTTYGDVTEIPLLEPADFINGVKYMYFTPMRSCNAAVMLKTIVTFTPCVRRMDYILDGNSVMKHELTHANAKLQGYPLGWYVNLELMAALLPFLEQPTNLNNFFYHTYLETPWEVLWVMTGFDIEKVRKQIYRYSVPFGGSALNEEALRQYLPEINKASQFLRESGLKVIEEFYSDPHAWLAVNDMSYDDDMMYRVIMAKLYEPTILGSHEETVRFILRFADESKDVAKKAMERVGKPQKDNERARNDLAALAKMLGTEPEALERFARINGIRMRHFEKVDPEVLRRIFSEYLSAEGTLPYQMLKEMR